MADRRQSPVDDRVELVPAEPGATISWRPFLKALYPVGVLLIIASVVDPSFRIWPLDPGSARWRFGAVGFFSSALAGVAFGMAWLIGVAGLLDQRRAMRALSGLSVFVGAILLLVLLGFGLDALQVRATVNPQLMASFDSTVAKAAGSILLAAAVFLMVGVGGWISARRMGRSGHVRSTPGKGLLFHSQSKGGAT